VARMSCSEKKIRYLTKDNKELYKEMAERGIEITDISHLVIDGKGQMTEEIYDSIITIIKKYIIRCSDTQTQRRLEKKYGEKS
jgi:hypothetical protein